MQAISHRLAPPKPRARPHLLHTFARLALAWGAALLCAGTVLAASAPSQSPLYSAVPGAKPNLMFVLDNSGSMGFEFQEGYSVSDSCPNGEFCANNNKYGWYAMRSSAINTQYYNPSMTYLPRIDAKGKPKENPLTFVDNQSSKPFYYSADGTDYNIQEEPYAPKYTEYTTNSVPGDKKFTYVQCKNNDCSTSANRTVVDLTFSAGNETVVLPIGHTRSDCGKNATTCTKAQELKNVLNWHEWYRTRARAVATSVGRAMQNYDNKFRVGYSQYNQIKNAATYGEAKSIQRGVRYFRDDAGSNNWKTQFYDWLYGVIPIDGTPSHYALALVADYYAGASTYADSRAVRATYGNPWKNDPTKIDAENSVDDLSCRRSYAIVLSDGAWSDSKTGVRKYASRQGDIYEGKPGGNAAKLRYDPNGAAEFDNASLATRLTARNLYIPYGDGGISSNGFADLTAYFFWHKDFSSLPNNVPPIGAQHNPTFWQNMTTFVIGWGLTPLGDQGVNGGLKWAQINKYNNDWLAGVPTSSLVKPAWAGRSTSVDLNVKDGDRSLRVDDFIRAGFTGGGRAYSVYSGDDVRKAMDNALSSMVGSGNDAGVAVSGSSSEFQTLDNQFKYTTEYQTSDNSGDIKAFQLNASGGYLGVDASGKPTPAWSANARMPAVAERQIFALSGYDADKPSAAPALRMRLSYGTTLGSLPEDLQKLLNADALQPKGTEFVRYLLGDDPQTDKNGTTYRLRKQPVGASVNSSPVFVGARVDMGYDVLGTVDGRTSYKAYRTAKRTLPSTIFAATNNGKVHVLNAAKTDTVLPGVAAGEELAAFMPKGGMAAQIDMAASSFHFRYTLDGPLVTHDVYDAKGQTPAGGEAAWRQLVMGTGGRGGRFMYGLESPLGTADRIPAKDHFLWEVDTKTAGYADLAHITNNPAAGQLDDGTWVMLTGSGHYGGAGKKVGLYVVEALTGKLKAFIALPEAYGNDAAAPVVPADGSATSATPVAPAAVPKRSNRGLGGVVAVRDSTLKVVAAYAGDANGNLWRFDLRSARLAVSYGRPLFTTQGGKAQPIYAAPAWQVHPGDASSCNYSTTSQCGAMVVVATGMLLDEDDLAKPATAQAIYGIWDKTPIGGNDKDGAEQVGLRDLVEQTIDLTSKKAGKGEEAGKNFYQVSSNPVDWKKKKGWLMQLGTIAQEGAMPHGERVVGDLSNMGSNVQVTSFLPEDKNLSIESCTPTSSQPNIVYALDALTGKNKYAFDVDGNGTPDSYSIVAIPSGGFTRGSVSSRNMIGQSNEGRPDLKPETECTGQSGFLTGVGGTQKISDGCAAPKAWRRSWRPVVSPPF